MEEYAFASPQEQAVFRQSRELIIATARERRLQLNLGDRGLTILPPEIGDCDCLEVLNLRNNALTTLPASLGRCRNLEVLRLDGNPLTSLPPELGECDALQHLNLGGHRLQAIPKELARCRELRELSLRGGCCLAEWPLFGKWWPRLRVLILSGCGLAELPPGIEECGELRALHLEGNGLLSITDRLRRLRQLDRLYLHGNEKLNLPVEVLGPSAAEVAAGKPHAPARTILDYYYSCQTVGSQGLNEVKLVFVGRGGAGKSSLVDRLVNDRFNPKMPETSGVALCDWVIHPTERGDPVTVHVWDFAGQVITHAAHQFFFSIRTVYVLVLTGRENSEREDAEYWLRMVQTYGTDEKGQGPPTIVVLNKFEDQRSSRPKIDRLALRERYPFVVEIVETDCATRLGIDHLAESLGEVICRQEWVRLRISRTWSAVKAAVTQKSESYLAYQDFRRLCRDYGVRNVDEQESLAETLHRLGVALNYGKDPRLRDATVLKPHWLTENVYRMIRFAEERAGLFSWHELSKVLEHEEDARMRRFLVDLMVRFEIAYPINDEDKEPRGWLVPQGLPDSQPSGMEVFARTEEATRLRYSYRVLPSGLVPRFIVRVHPLIEGEQRWASGVVLALDGARALVRATPEDKLIEISAIGPASERQKLTGLCQSEFRSLHAELRGLQAHETMLISGDWVPVATLERDEGAQRPTGVRTDGGTIEVNPVEKLNELTLPAARDDSWKPRVFVSYAHEDEAKRSKLDLHLRIFANAGLIEPAWHDCSIQAGEEWDRLIRAEMERADISIFLVSTASLASHYITQVEIPAMIERHKAGKTRFVAILLEPCPWTVVTAISELQVLPRDGKELSRWNPRAHGWNDVCKHLQTICETLRANHAGQRRTTPG